MKLRLSSLILLALLLVCLPASAKMSNVVKNEEVGVQIETPDDGIGTYTKIEIYKEDPKRYEGGRDYFVSKVIDLRITDANRRTASLKPLRAVFFFDEIDFKRASRLDTTLPIGHFRIGLLDEGSNTWQVLPSQVFWNGSNGAVEADVGYGGKYALLWSNQNTNLSPIAEEKIRIMINNSPVFSTVNPYVNAGTTMVPLRVVAENLGLKVDWNSKERRVDLRKYPDEINLWVGNPQALVNKEEIMLAKPAEIKAGNTFVPIRFIAEALGAQVSWDDTRKTVFIVKHN